MKTKHLFLSLFITLPVLACGDLSKKPSYLSARLNCGTLWHDIEDPMINVGRAAYPLAVLSVDISYHCPASDPNCFIPKYNWDRRTDALCKAYGFGKSVGEHDSGIFTNYTQVVELVQGKNGLTPHLMQFNDHYVVIKRVSCLPH